MPPYPLTRTSFLLWCQQNSISHCVPGSSVPAANMTSFPKKARGLGVGGTLEGGAEWHQSWLQKGHQWLWDSVSPGASARLQEGGGLLGEGHCHPRRGQGFSREENKKGPLLQVAASQLCRLC